MYRRYINSFIDSPYYATGVVMLSYDEHGGLYDHVKPMTVVAPDNIPPISPKILEAR